MTSPDKNNDELFNYSEWTTPLLEEKLERLNDNLGAAEAKYSPAGRYRMAREALQAAFELWYRNRGLGESPVELVEELPVMPPAAIHDSRQVDAIQMQS